MEPDDECMACPYDKNHLIHPLRMPYHLLKCRKNFPDIQLAVCPYSAMHEVPPMELQFHMANCPSKRLVEGVDQPHALAQALCGKEISVHKGCTDIPPMTTVSFDDDDENWDEQIGENQEQLLPVPQTHHRRRAQEANNLRSLRSNVSADLLVRRPKSHSVAQKMNSGVDSDSSLTHMRNGRFEDSESEDYHSDSVSQSYLFGQGDRSSRYTTDRTTASALDISKDFSHGKSIILPEKEGEIQIGSRTTSDIRQRLRGRGSLLEYLPDRPERRPGQQYSLMITAGRGRFTGNIPLKP